MVTFLVRQGPAGRRPLMTGLATAGRGARRAGSAGWTGAKRAGHAAAHGAKRGAELVDELPFDEIGGQIGDYLETAKHVIEDTVTGELQDLRKAIRRQRKRMGL